MYFTWSSQWTMLMAVNTTTKGTHKMLKWLWISRCWDSTAATCHLEMLTLLDWDDSRNSCFLCKLNVSYKFEYRVSKSVTDDWISTASRVGQVLLQDDCMVLNTPVAHAKLCCAVRKWFRCIVTVCTMFLSKFSVKFIIACCVSELQKWIFVLITPFMSTD